MTKLVILIFVISLALTIPFLVFFENQKPESHCNNTISTGKIINIKKIGQTTIINLENNGVIKKQVVDNYYYQKYNMNDSIIHCDTAVVEVKTKIDTVNVKK